MKRLLLVSLVAMISVTGCKKESSKPVNPNLQIAGTWHDVTDVYTTTKNGVTTVVGTQQLNPSDYVLFNSDGTGAGHDANLATAFSYNVASSTLQLTETVTINSVPVTRTWNIAIKKLTSTTLELYFVIGPDATGYSENHDVTYSK